MSNMVHVPYPDGLCGQKIYNPSLPFTRKIGCLYPGKMIFVSGIPDPNCNKFTVSLMSGQHMAFRIGARIDWEGDKEVIIRNTKKDDKWGTDEKALSCAFPFKRGKFFEMTILVEASGYKVAVNGEHLFEFKHRISPLEDVDTLHINEDIRVCMIRIQG